MIFLNKLAKYSGSAYLKTSGKNIDRKYFRKNMELGKSVFLSFQRIFAFRLNIIENYLLLINRQ